MRKSFPTVKPKYKPLTASGLGCAADDGNSMGSSGPSASLSSLEIRPWTRGEGARRLPSSCLCFSSSGVLSDTAADRLEKQIQLVGLKHTVCSQTIVRLSVSNPHCLCNLTSLQHDLDRSSTLTSLVRVTSQCQLYSLISFPFFHQTLWNEEIVHQVQLLGLVSTVTTESSSSYSTILGLTLICSPQMKRWFHRGRNGLAWHSRHFENNR